MGGEIRVFAVRAERQQWAAAAGDEAAQLEQIVQEGVKAGMHYITDSDARPAGAAHPLANLWDNGSDPIAMLKHEMEVRRIGLSKFGLKNVPAGSALSLLEAKLLPLYLHHRFQLQAAVKSVGGAILFVCGARGERTEPVTGAADRAGRRAARGARRRARDDHAGSARSAG